jgi:hypothetical protein
VGAAAPTPPLSAALGFCLADDSLPRTTKRLAGGAAASTPTLPAALGFLQTASTAGNDKLGSWGLPPPPPLSAALGFCLADGSLQRATKRLAGGGCSPHTPAFRCARLLSCRWLGTGNKTLDRWGGAAFCCARLLFCRRLATAGNNALGSQTDTPYIFTRSIHSCPTRSSKTTHRRAAIGCLCTGVCDKS